MTQKDVDTIFQIALTVHQSDWFGNNEDRRDQKEVAEWVAMELAETRGIYTVPVGSSWGIITNEKTYKRYYEK